MEGEAISTAYEIHISDEAHDSNHQPCRGRLKFRATVVTAVICMSVGLLSCVQIPENNLYWTASKREPSALSSAVVDGSRLDLENVDIPDDNNAHSDESTSPILIPDFDCSTFFMKTFSIPTMGSLLGYSNEPNAQLMCIPTCHLGKEFIAHSEIKQGPREVREMLMEIEWINTNKGVFKVKIDVDTGTRVQLEHVEVYEEYATVEKTSGTQDSFGKLLTEFPILQYLRSETSPSKQMYCVSAASFLSETIPLVLSTQHQDILNGAKSEKSERYSTGSDQNSNLFTSSSRSIHSEIKSFPRNIVYSSTYIDAAQGGSWSLVSSIALLPENVMKRRQADDRVGFFETSVKYYGDLSTTNRYINRFRREKHKQTAIVFYVDRSVPNHLHSMMQNGVQAWSEAFNFSTSHHTKTVVKCILPSSPEYPSDYDSFDTRYNSILWMEHSAGYSVSHSIIDPRSGEVLASKIFIDSGHIQASFEAWILASYHNAPKATSTDAQAHRALLEVFGTVETYSNETIKRRLSNFLTYPSPIGKHPILDETRAQILNCLSYVVTHETGHSLGLRHNFKGSTMYTYDQISDKSFVKANGISSSIMDYLPSNIQHNELNDSIPLCQSSIGVYDRWAIMYGYQHMHEVTNSSTSPNSTESEYLRSIAALALPFGSDEYLDEPFPFIRQFDLGSNPVQYYESLLKFASDTENHLEIVSKQLSYNDPTDWERLWKVKKTVLKMVKKAGLALTEFMGGSKIKYIPSTSASQLPDTSPVPYDTQLRCLHLVLKIILQASPRSDGGKIVSSGTSRYMERTGDCEGLDGDCLGWRIIEITPYIKEHIVDPMLFEVLDIPRMQRIDSQKASSFSTTTTFNLQTFLECSMFAFWNVPSDNCAWKDALSTTVERGAEIKEYIQMQWLTGLIDVYESDKTNESTKSKILMQLYRLETHLSDILSKQSTSDPYYWHILRCSQLLKDTVTA